MLEKILKGILKFIIITSETRLEIHASVKQILIIQTT